MKQLFPRGKRIRPTDKDLVFYTALASLLPVFLLVVLLFHIDTPYLNIYLHNTTIYFLLKNNFPNRNRGKFNFYYL